MITFVQISDTHFGASRDFISRQANPFEAATRIVDAINALPVRPDFVIHTGDVVENPDEDAAYQLAQSVFERLDCPIYFVTGNHDRTAQIRQWLTMGERTDLAAEQLFYRFSIGDEQFLVLDGRGADEIDPAGVISAEQLTYLQSLPTTGEPLTIFIHFPAHPVGSNWIDDGMLLQNGAALHSALLPLRDRLRGVFHGHLHQTMQVVYDGITYSCGASAYRQFRFWRSETDDVENFAASAGFNWVACADEKTIVRQIELPTVAARRRRGLLATLT